MQRELLEEALLAIQPSQDPRLGLPGGIITVLLIGFDKISDVSGVAELLPHEQRKPAIFSHEFGVVAFYEVDAPVKPSIKPAKESKDKNAVVPKVEPPPPTQAV